MAFRFDARADSSDEDAGGLDLSAWTIESTAALTASKSAPVAQTVPPIVENEEESVTLDGRPEARNFARKRKRRSPDSDISMRVASVEKDGDVTYLKSSATRPKALQVAISLKEVRRAMRGTVINYTAGGDRVDRVYRETREGDGTVVYTVQFEDYHEEEIAFNDLLTSYDNGEQVIDEFNNNQPTMDSESDSIAVSNQPEAPRSRGRPRGRGGRMGPIPPVRRTRTGRGARRHGLGQFVNTMNVVDGSDQDVSDDDEDLTATKLSGRKRKRQDRSQYVAETDPENDHDEEDESEDELSRPKRTPGRNVRTATNSRHNRSSRGRTASKMFSNRDDDDLGSDGIPIFESDLSGHRRQKSPKSVAEATRQSGRMTRHTGDMQEVEMDDIFRSDSEEPRQPIRPKNIGVKEIFVELPRNNDFRMRHNQHCETCGQGANFAKLVNCQGCSLVYHKQCLGHRTGREHLVTKVGNEDFVLQCRRCVAVPKKKDHTAPDQGKCSECQTRGTACKPFRSRKTPAQEVREREDNDGVDPIYDVSPELINNVDNVLFRCTQCFRGFHYEHLPSRAEYDIMETEVDPEQRFREYSRDWKCKECADMPAKISGIIAWKPIDEDNYDPGNGLEGIDEEEKVYLVRWEGMSYFRARWVPGPWVWGVTTGSMRKAFAKRDDSLHPKMRTEDAIPEDYLRTDIVLDIKYTSYVDIRTQEIDKARIREVEKALIKYKGLNYEDSVWETPPGPDDGERWSDFVTAYNDWVAGRYIRCPKPTALRTRLARIRREDFGSLEKTAQPDSIQGQLMQYQIQGLNWLYYKWYTQANAILADEMGLGKTIQIIGFLGTLVQDHNCFPFLVVVPNSTCPNWRREVKRWAPDLRVVAYYGSRESRDMAYRYELFPEGSKDLRSHIVVTSYDTAADENSRRFFKSVPWQGLIVDEGQRLKNDKNLLYSALSSFRIPFKILLTGTPLQNNQRELFNLLHFLDDSHDAARLEEQYDELDQAKIEELHNLIRPFFLRRTKAQVLTFLPPMSQIIVPVSMTIVQKKLYRSIIAKNPDLMKAIFSTEATTVKQSERGSLNNILMQLRKCLCHPFVYNRSIEDQHVDIGSTHRNLVEASSKLKLLELLLPKLEERGHRVLIFSQFLDMLDMVEDFMDGMQLRYQRLDGNINALTKQKRIDEFNAEGSPLFAFLLSTRAGGVGINLASADTVIILDPDFNPHQDIQALSRAHRIGQKKKVLCFQLVTRASAEERIMQTGRKKLALDQVLIQHMDADDEEQHDLASILRHGTAELFEDDGENDIHYDTYNVERLLDRSHIENTVAGDDKTAEAQFSFARIWANDAATLQEVALETEESAPDPGLWANILKERERLAADEAAAKAEAFGRGRRTRNAIDYTGEAVDEDAIQTTPIKHHTKRERGPESDTDFQADDTEDDEISGEIHFDHSEPADLDETGAKRFTGKKDSPVFRRAILKPVASGPPPTATTTTISFSVPAGKPPAKKVEGYIIPYINKCRGCQGAHAVGSCPLKLTGPEYCNLCGIAHYGHMRVCPHIQSETQVRAMLEALKYSQEPEHLVKEARRYLKGLKGNLVQIKRQKHQKAREAAILQQQQQQYGHIGGYNAVNEDWVGGRMGNDDF